QTARLEGTGGILRLVLEQDLPEIESRRDPGNLQQGCISLAERHRLFIGTEWKEGPEPPHSAASPHLGTFHHAMITQRVPDQERSATLGTDRRQSVRRVVGTATGTLEMPVQSTHLFLTASSIRSASAV